MLRFASCLALLAVAAAPAAETATPAITTEEIASPAAPHSVGAALATAPDGTLWLSWVEPGRDGANILRCATLDRAAKKWRTPHTIATGKDVTTNSADFPQLAIDGSGRVTALWTDGKGGANFSQSTDGGVKWSAGAPWAPAGIEVEKFSLVTLADGRVLVAWLDGRGRQAGGKMQQVYARIVGASGPDMLVDGSVCDCCQTTLTAFPDGTALAAYRGRTEEEVRDIRVARLRGRQWDEPRALNNDDWRINGCPVNGPRLASDGGRVGVAWFTAADNDARVLASYSPDAGARFLLPLRVDRGKPTGGVETLLLHDGALLVTWLEADGSLWLRRITPEFSLDEPFSLAAGANGKVKGFARAALVRDYTGGKTPAQFVIAFAREGAAPTVRTLLVTVPEGDLLEAEKHCDCAPSAEELQGFPIRGMLTEALPATAALRVKHFEVPGIFGAGTREFKVAPALLAAVAPGRQFIGRIERRDGAWWLFDLRLVAEPQK